MIEAERQRLGNRVYGVRIAQRVRLPDDRTVIWGFDSEYISHPDQHLVAPTPVSWQLHDGERGHFMPLKGEKLKLSDLTRALMAIRESRDPQATHIVLAAWFAQAEISILENDMQAENLHLGNGLYGLRWVLHFSKRKRVQFTIFDLMAFPGRMSLAEASGGEKGAWDHARTTLDSVNDPEFRAYALRDAELCQQIGVQVHNEFSLLWGVSPFQLTSVGHLGSTVFRHHYLQADVMQPVPDVRELALIAYRGSGDYGGCWWRGVAAGEWGEFDAVSMYPRACALLGVLPRRGDWRPWREGEAWPETGLYRAQIDWPADCTRRTLMAIVPDGAGGERYAYPQTAVDVWTGFELAAAQRLGCRVRIISGQWYESGTDALPSFMYQASLKRAQHQRAGRPALAAVYKNMSNTMIGKLGQHRAHTGYSLSWDEERGHNVYARNEEEYSSWGSLFAPEWWCLIIGYARSVMMEVIAEFGAVHCNVDAVLLNLPGVQEFERRGITFRRKSSGQLLRLAQRNLWILEQDGAVQRFAAFGGRDIPQLRAAMQRWDGSATVRAEYADTQLITIPQHARDPDTYPLMSTMHQARRRFTVPALASTTDEHGRLPAPQLTASAARITETPPAPAARGKKRGQS